MDEIQVTQQEYNAQGAHIFALKQELSSAIERRELERKQGDLSENASFEAACNDITRLTSMLHKEEDKYQRMHIVGRQKGIGVGTTFIVHDELMDQDLKITLVGTEGKPPVQVSKNSLFGRAAYGKNVGDVITYSDILHRTQTFYIKEIIHDSSSS